MASTVSLDGVKKAVFFPFQGKSWGVKILIGVALFFANFLVVPLLFVMGYSAQVMKRIIVKDEDPEMPEWNDWGTLLLDGLKLYGAVLIYELPSLILIIGGYFLGMALNIGFSLATVPIMANSSDPSAVPILPFFGGMAGMFGGMAVAMFGIVLSFVSMVFIPPAVGNMIAKGEFSAAFRVREWWPVMKANVSGYVLTIVIAMGLFSVMYILIMVLYMTIVLCFLLPVVLGIVGFITSTITYALYAIAYRDGVHKLAAAA